MPENLDEIFSVNECDPPEDKANSDSKINPDGGDPEVGNPDDGNLDKGYPDSSYPDDNCFGQTSIIFIPFRLADLPSLLKARAKTGEVPAFYPGVQYYLPPQEHDFESDLPILPPLPFAPYAPKITEQTVQQEPQSIPHGSRIPVGK